MITEKDITEILKSELQPLPYIYALWLEGSFAMGQADEYSDIDYWMDVDDEYVKDVGNRKSEIEEFCNKIMSDII